MTAATGPKIKSFLEGMWQNYLELTPDAGAIHSLFARLNNGIVVNDHIALRTFNLDRITVMKLAEPFQKAGYRENGQYQFPERKLTAKYFLHPDPTLPKVFISELLVEQLTVENRSTVQQLVKQMAEGAEESDDFCYCGRPWRLSIAEYEQLLAESEYAAWVAAFGFRPNHFTVSINHLSSHSDINDVNQLLQENGYTLNSSGGLVKGSPEVLLEQSSTLASEVTVDFSDGKRDIPGCFYEFAKRYPQPDGKLYQGFVAASADKIFESTDTGISTRR